MVQERKYSRQQAKEYFNHLTEESMKKTNMSSYVITNSKSILITEHPDCYKDINEIMNLLKTEHGLNIIAQFKPLLTIKY